MRTPTPIYPLIIAYRCGHTTLTDVCARTPRDAQRMAARAGSGYCNGCRIEQAAAVAR